MSIIACTSGNGYNKELERVQEIINDSPQKALALTEKISVKGGLSKSQRMRCLLLNMQARDKNNMPISEEGAAIECVKYYESNGSNNDKALAYYLLGSVYRDMNDSPVALEYYLKAVNVADTLGNECNPRLLRTIYGQISDIYHLQNLPQEEMEAQSKYKKYADMLNDKYESLIAECMFVRPYFLLKQNDLCLKIGLKAYNDFLMAGYKPQAAASLMYPIHIYIERGDYDNANHYINVYDSLTRKEKDGKSNINYYKGLNALHYGETEKAGGYFSTLIGTGQDEAAYRGMMLYYQRKRDIDSVVKYANLYADANDTMHTRMRNSTIEQMSALYNYSRYQTKAMEEENHAENLAYWLLAMTVVFFLTVSAGSYLYRRYKRKKTEETNRLKNSYKETVAQMNKTREDLDILESNHRTLLEQKKREIEQLARQKAEYEELYKKFKVEDEERKFHTSDVVRKFHKMATPKLGQKPPEKADWVNAFLAAEQHLPAFYALAQWNKLSERERKVLLLLKMGMKNADIKILMGGISDQTVSNTKARINNKLFKDCKAATIEENLEKRVFQK